MTDLIEDLIENFITAGFIITYLLAGIIVGFGVPLLFIYLFLRAVHFLYTGVW